MHWSKPEVDYRRFRLNQLNTPEFSHLWMLLYWPIYGLLFAFVERFYPVENYHVMHCVLDDYIPFNELFLIPYLFWFVYLAGMLVYTLFYDVDGFKRMMRFVMVTYTVTIVVYLLFPTCQELRPETFPRDNVLVRFVQAFYAFDTNTNVCPSIHVIGSLAAMFTSWHSKAVPAGAWRWASTICSVLICMSTMFMKQHSALDVLAALPLSFFAYWLCWHCALPERGKQPLSAKD